MKKLYFAPKIEIVRLTSHTLLAAVSRTEDEAGADAEALGREFTFSNDVFEEENEE